jgi:glycosyltransferase involved in cell wall biosynthesis
MIGWELPPHNSGGLGIACAGLSQAIAQSGTQVQFTLPYLSDEHFGQVQIVDCRHPRWLSARTTLRRPPFSSYAPVPSPHLPRHVSLPPPYSDLERQVSDYATMVLDFARAHADQFDLVHAHDWMSMPAAMKIKAELQKPYIAHMHSTEYDRSLTADRQSYITGCELEGMKLADRVIAVSYYTKRLLVEKYAIDPEKIDVVHNGVVGLLQDLHHVPREFAAKRPVIVFMGRLTVQKGPDYFLQLAEKVITSRPEALFIVSGMGDMYQQLLLTNAGKSLSANVLFSGFVRGGAQEAILKRADIFVMPSISEPFGLVATEAAVLKTPVIASKTSGVVEVMHGAPKFDFWDSDAMSQEVLHLLNDPTYRDQVVAAQLASLKQTTWKKAAAKIKKIYDRLMVTRSRRRR